MLPVTKVSNEFKRADVICEACLTAGSAVDVASRFAKCCAFAASTLTATSPIRARMGRGAASPGAMLGFCWCWVGC